MYMYPYYLKRDGQISINNIVAAFRGMHVSPVKHSYACLPRNRYYRTDRRMHPRTHTHTDRRRTK